VKIRNLPLGASYPSRGSVQAIVDTGYDGFLLVPRHVFEALSLDEMVTRTMKIEVPDGRTVESTVAYATVEFEDAKREVDGPVETMDGLEEVLAGTRMLCKFKLTLDYCLRVISVRPCV